MQTETTNDHGPAPPGSALSAAEQANRAQQALIALVQRMAHEIIATLPEPDAPAQFTLRLDLDPQREWQPAASHTPLQRQIRDALEELSARSDAFQPGRVFCHRCRSAQCTHAAPPRATAVFAAYSPTGVPEWKDFHQVLLDAGDERVDQLFAEDGPVLSCTMLGRDLKRQMLPAFGKSSKSYSVLGQVAAGYYGGAGAADRCAVTLQIVECRGASGVFRLEANVIGHAPSGAPAADALRQGELPDVTRACRIAARELRELERQVREQQTRAGRGEAQHALRRVPALLARLAVSLERAHRQSSRRTIHASRRKEEHRPTDCAVKDAQRADAAAFLCDERNRTTIVRGPRNRVHAFSADARHVTSFTILDNHLEKRLRSKQWRPATPEEISAFRAALHAALEPPAARL